MESGEAGTKVGIVGKRAIAWLLPGLLFLGLLSLVTACRSGSGPEATGLPLAAATSRVATKVVPSPSAPPPPAPSPLPAPTGSGWTTYLGVNDVQGLAFAPDGTLWAATTGGAVHWDLADDSYTQYTAADGLTGEAGQGPASSYVRGVALAPDGSVWLATLGGVSHWTGTGWTNYSTADGLVSDAVQGIAVTADGQVWAGTTEGISRFSGGRWTAYQPGMRAWQVAAAPDGAVWFADQGAGAGRYSPADDTWTSYAEAGGAPLQGVTALAVGPAGDVWVYENWAGVYHLAPGAGDGQWQKVWEHTALVCALAVAGDGTPWIGTCGSMHYLFGNLLQGQAGGWQEITGWHELGQPAIRSLAFGPGETMAVGTEKGLAVRQDGAWRTLRGGPTRNRVTAAAVTADGAAWFGFGNDPANGTGGGVSRFDGQTWGYDLGDSNVRLLATAPDGTLWAGSGCEVQHFDGTVWQVVGTCDDLGPASVLDLAFGPEGIVWAATGMSLARFDGRTWQDMGKMVHSVAAGPDGSLWASGWEGSQDSFYVARYDGGQWQEVLDRSLASLAVTPDGMVWGLDGENGLVRFDGAAWQPAAGPDGAAAYGLLAVAPDGALWLSGPAHLARLDAGTWTTYPAVEGVQSLAIGPEGTVWLGTGNGVVRFEPGMGQ